MSTIKLLPKDWEIRCGIPMLDHLWQFWESSTRPGFFYMVNAKYNDYVRSTWKLQPVGKDNLYSLISAKDWDRGVRISENMY